MAEPHPGTDGAFAAAGAPFVRHDGPAVTFRVVPYDDPQCVRLVDAVQAFYVERYGGADRTPVDPAEFAPPRGLFVLGSLPGTGPVCCGGWRRHDTATIDDRDREVLRPGDAEIKRMWVDPARRRRGLASAVLAELERTATAAGCRRTVLETGAAQPEALAFYRGAGYAEMRGFGVYRDEPGSICFARDLRPRARPPAGWRP